MKTSRESSKSARSPQPVNILLAYDSPRTCAATMKMLDRISTRLQDKGLFNVNAFKFGLLENMDPLQGTAANADAVELAMVAFNAGSAPGAGLLRWFENWARGHAGREAGLGLLPLGRQTGQSVRRMARALREIAARYKLGFIYQPETGFDSFQDAFTAAA
jgi:hypothetical protein